MSLVKSGGKLAIGAATGGVGSALMSLLGSSGGGGAPRLNFGGGSPGGSLNPLTQGPVAWMQNMGAIPRTGRIAPQNGQCPKGYHLNKHDLQAGKHVSAAPARTVCVRNRHLNPANGRAIGRSVRRIKAGEKQYRRVFTIMHHKAAGKLLPRRKK
jgi:hypothetical protein